MDKYLIMVFIVSLASLIVLTVCTVQALIQVRRTARAWEILAKSLDSEVNKVGNVTGLLSTASLFMRGTVGRLASTLIGLIGLLFRPSGHRNGDQKSASEQSPKEEEPALR